MQHKKRSKIVIQELYDIEPVWGFYDQHGEKTKSVGSMHMS